MLGNLIPLLNPIRVAEEYAMLDVMSGGRLIAGMIRGVPHEYIAYNVVPDESRERLREAAALIVKAGPSPSRSAGRASSTSTPPSPSGRGRCSSRIRRS